MTLHVQLRIKFRAFFVTFYQMDRTFDLPLASVPVPVPLNRVLFDERGIYLKVWNTQ